MVPAASSFWLSSPADSCTLADVDPELIYQLDHDSVVLSRHLSVEVRDMNRGSWELHQNDSTLAYLIVEGIVLQAATSIRQRSLEVAGPGDMLLLPREVSSDVPPRVAMAGLTDATIAIITQEHFRALGSAPELMTRVFDRIERSSDHLRFRVGLASVPRLSDRLHLLLWHFAERWGVRRHGTTFVELPAKQATLAELVGASRSSVSLALKELQQSRRAILHRRRTWELSDDRYVR